MVAAQPPRTATTRVVTEINRTAILDALRNHGPLSRKQIGARTGLSPATVERLSSALLAERLIEQDGLKQSSGGRPSYLLRYSGGSRLIAAIDVSATAARGRLLDLDGSTVESRSVGFALAKNAAAPTERLDGTLRLIDDLVGAASALDRTCGGIGIAVPGIIHDGRVMNTAELGWRELPLESIVSTRTGLPTIVENDANAIAYGEWTRGVAKNARTVASFVLGVGVGAGIVNDGNVYRGSRSAAGEVGFLFADVGAMRNYYADRGDLETRIADVALRAVPEAASIDAAIARLIDTAADGTADQGDADDLFDLLAFTCGAIATVFDTEVIVVAGHLLRAPEFVIAELHRRLVGRIPFPPRLIAASLGDDSALLGVGELITKHVRGSIYLA